MCSCMFRVIWYFYEIATSSIIGQNAVREDFRIGREIERGRPNNRLLSQLNNARADFLIVC